MSIKFHPAEMIKKLAPESKIKKLVSKGVTLKKAALSFIDEDVIDKKSVAKVALKTIRGYQERIAKTNPSKLDREIRANATFGSVYNYCSTSGDQLTVYFTQNLNQTQIDALSAFISAFSNVSIYDTLYAHLKSNIDPFVEELLIGIRAENIEMGITQSGKTLEVLGFFETPFALSGKVRAVTLQGSLTTGSLTVTIEILDYLIANPSLYSDINPYVTAERLTVWKNKIIAKLA